MSKDKTMVSSEANIKIKQSLENTYRAGLVDGIKMGKESCVKNNDSAVERGTFVLGVVLGIILGMVF